MMHEKATPLPLQTTPVRISSKNASLKRKNDTSKCRQHSIQEARIQGFPRSLPSKEAIAAKNDAFTRE
jgi:hypothetical protein